MIVEKRFLLLLNLLGVLRFGTAWNHVVLRPMNPMLGARSIGQREPPPFRLRTAMSKSLQSFSLRQDVTKYPLQDQWNISPGRHAVQLYTTLRQAAPENTEGGETTSDHKGWWGRVKGYFLQDKQDDGLTFKQRLAKMGVATVLSYGMISNLSYAILISLAWYGFAVQTGTTPLAPGQWKPFLAVYAGFWMFNNIIRPLRLGLSIAVAPSLDKLVLFFQNRLKVSKALAITVTVLFVNVIGTTLLMGGGIALAALLAGVPIFPPR